MQDEILSGELARLCGVSPDTLRHYERLGVLPAGVRGANGYRRFPREAVGRVLLIRRAIAIGFSLVEAGERLEGLDRRIAEMQAEREELARMLMEWDARLARTCDGEPARLLENDQRESRP